MLKKKSCARWGLPPLAVALCAVACTAPALGQNAPGTPAATGPASQPAGSPMPLATHAKPAPRHVKISDKPPTAPNAVVNLVNLLVKQGVIKPNQAQALIKEAEDEAYIEQQASKDATTKADQADKAASDAAAAANPPGTKHVTYVPEYVKQQLAEQVKAEVMARAEKENWASPGLYPEWASRIHFYGDVRARYQANIFPSGNDKIGAVNFNAINTGSPYDTSEANTYYPPTYDVGENRNEFAMRARLGMEADLNAGFTAGMRIATGNDDSPVSTNQTMGGNGSFPGGNFAKYEAWLDRAYLRNEQGNKDSNISISIGRFDNPFWSPTDLIWYSELGFDGVALQAQHAVSSTLTPFVDVGAFPIFNTNLNASINLGESADGGPVDLPSEDKYLFAGQVGLRAQVDPQIAARVAVAFYDFDNVRGELSSPCTVDSSSDVCDTDNLRPSFAQKGNTYMPLRDIIPDTTNDLGAADQYQYFGLASAFRPLDVSGQLDFSHFNPVHVVLDADYVWNTAFDRNAVAAVAVNNLSGTTTGALGAFDGGAMGWMVRLTVGDPKIQHFGDWSVNAAYKYLESDATIDAFTDPDFGLGGTNLKGYILGANFGLSENVWATLRWLSANNIGGTPYAVDVVQADLNARF